MPDAPQPTVNYPWNPDAGDGTFFNPVICADYSDPDVIRDGDDFWMTASSFNCTPGLPILHSKDLVNWTLVTHAIKNNPDPRKVFDTPRHGEGVWAPAIRKHNGLFYIFVPLPDEGIYVLSAKDPRGPWSEPWMLLEGKGYIDPCPLWDDDGQAYMVHAYANSRIGIKHRLTVRPMSPDCKKLLGEGQTVFDMPEKHPTLEGPKFHKRDGYYYISAPAGGVATGWQVILRSKNVYGPYEDKIVLHQGNTPINGPHQGAIVDTPAGENWFLHFQDAGVYGRIIHLQPVEWKDGWPLMGVNRNADDIGEPTLHHKKPALPESPKAVPATSDDFTAPALGLQWQWHANFKDDWHSIQKNPARLRLNAIHSEDDFLKVPNLLLQKFPAYAFTVDTELSVTPGDAATQAGLIIMGQKHAALVLDGAGNVRLLVDNQPTAEATAANCSARFRVSVAAGGLCTFAVAKPGEDFQPLGEPFQAMEGRWIGAKVGLFCRSMTDNPQGHADVSYFRFAPPATI